jgi:N-acetylmuramoyl-L-alanine amidase
MHPKDREVIQTPEFAQATAQSIVEGLKLYFKK